MDSPSSLLSSSQTRGTLKKTGVAAGAVGTVGGFVSDVLEPVAPLASYVFYISLAALVVLILLCFIARGTRKWAVPGSLLTLVIGLMAGAVLALQSSSDEADDRGFVAANVPAIASLQETMGLIQKDVAEIKENTVRIEEKTDKVLASVENIAESFYELSKQGGIIPNPETPQQHYHNARLQELKSDYGAARRSYLEYFKSDLEYLDPHLRFQDFLKVQEGREGARETYQYIANQSKTNIPDIASILLWDRAKRIPMLTQFASDNPDFAAGYYLLSLEFSLARVGTQSLEDLRQEKENLERFKELDGEGHFVRYFLDQELVADWRGDADKRLTALAVSSARIENPVSVTWMHTNSGWMGNVQIVEPALEIFWQEPGGSEFKSTGLLEMVNAQTGKPHPNMSISLPDGHPGGELQVKYTNAAGVEMGVYKAKFDPMASSLKSTKHILNLTKQSWVSFRDYDGKLLTYFTHLMSYRGVLAEIKYGVDKEVPDTTFEFPVYDKPGNATISADVPTYLDLPLATKFVSVQLTFKDDTKSEVMRFNR
jgi:hypothetical protein